MSFQYNFETLKNAILFNTVEVLPTEEAQLDKEIKVLVEEANKSGQPIKHYIGYEISGILHFGNNTYQMLKVAKLQQAGVQCMVWLADYHTKINKKLDGKMSTINKVAHIYFEPVIRKAVDICGGDGSKLQVLYAKDEYFRKNENDLSFWDFEFEAEEHLSVNRVLRSLSIAGKEAGDESDYKLTRYPGMQAADVFWHQTHLVQSGLDQRKIYVSCRDMADKLDPEFRLNIGEKSVKPITMFTRLLLGMLPPQTANTGSTQEAVSKMSKSRPDSAIFEHDSAEEISRKLKKAYCPMIEESDTEEIIEDKLKTNPLLNWCENLIFPAGKVVEINRPEKFGGNKSYLSFEEIQTDFRKGNLHPLDLKNGVALTLADWFAPIRTLVEQNPEGLELIKKARG
jgi:tyrosyl-tRNA synthetase